MTVVPERLTFLLIGIGNPDFRPREVGNIELLTGLEKSHDSPRKAHVTAHSERIRAARSPIKLSLPPPSSASRDWCNEVYIDHCVAFGSASSAGLFGRVADAFVAIIKQYGAEQVLKWVDDIIFFRFPIKDVFPYSYVYDASLIFSTTSALGLPLSLPKCTDFSNEFTYLGFLWDIPNRTVQIPSKKKVKFRNRCSQWINSLRRTRRDAQQLLGSLNHCCLAIRFARTKLHSLRTFLAQFHPNSSPFISLPIPQTLKDDLQWWISTLSQPFVGSTILQPPSPLPLQIFVDASTSWGIGILINGKWEAWKFSNGSLPPDYHIGWAEMVAVELAVTLLCSIHPNNSHFLIHSDNQGVIGAIESSASRGASQNASLSRLCSTLLFHDCFISTSYITSALNPADPISRGILPHDSSRLKTKLNLPPALVPFLQRS